MNLIAAADREWGIGKNNKLLASIPADMRQFREKTTGNVVVMGRKTLESFPDGSPLKDRTNIVLTRNPSFQAEGAIMVHSLPELWEALSPYDTDQVYVIGGGDIYRLLLPYCDTAFITRIDEVYDADTYFPDLDQDPEWVLVEESEEETCFDLAYVFDRYERRVEK